MLHILGVIITGIFLLILFVCIFLFSAAVAVHRQRMRTDPLYRASSALKRYAKLFKD